MNKHVAYPVVMRVLINKYLNDNNINNKKVILNNTYKYYGDFILEVPDIGGNRNCMSYNLYYSLAFFAFYEAMNRNINRDEFYDYLYKNTSGIINVISKFSKLFNKSINRALIKQFSNYKKLSESNNWANTWAIDINPHNRDTGIAFDFRTCPIADFALKHDYKDIMPVLCKMDFLTAKMMNKRLIRQNTIIENNKPCDYWYVEL